MSTPTPNNDNLRSLIYEIVDGKPTLQVLDQLLLPKEKKYISVPNIQTTWSVIQKMQIRGKNKLSCQGREVGFRRIPAGTV
jgi:methylthioribose-1-phosphate isomerase